MSHRASSPARARGAGDPASHTRPIGWPRQLRDEAQDLREQAQGAREQRRPFGGDLLQATGIERRQHVGLATRVFKTPSERSAPDARHEPEQVVHIPDAQLAELPAARTSELTPRGRRVSSPAARPLPPPDYLGPAPRPVEERRPRSAQAAAPQPAQAPRPAAPLAAPSRSAAAPRVEAPEVEPAPAPEPAGEVVVFFGCRGGVGSTLLATSVGAALAAAGVPTCLIDLDLQLGEAQSYLGVEPSLPISSLIRDLDRSDWEMLAARLPRHASGLFTLSQSGFVDELRELEPAHMSKLLLRLRRQFRVVLVDGVRDFNDHALAALDAAQRVVLVTTQDVPAIRGVARRLHILRRLGFPAERFQLVINRFSGSSPLNQRLVAEEIGLECSFTVSNDFPTASRAVNEGVSLRECDPRARLTVEVEEMARSLFGLRPAAGQVRGGLFARLFSRRKA